jgi:type III pantothenate kinase
MLLAIDVGNTETLIGVFDSDELRWHWRMATRPERTADELALLFGGFLELEGLTFAREITGVAMASVVPRQTQALREMVRRSFGFSPVVVEPGTKTGMPILYENPREVGADRIVNAVAAYQSWPQGAIVVDFGTATTFDVVTSRGEYAGGVIAPGLMVSADALYHATAKLPRVEIARPKNTVGRNTVASIQSGLVFGYAGLVDAIVTRIQGEVDYQPRVVGTGGLAPLIAAESKTIQECDDMLTLRGLALIYERNR